MASRKAALRGAMIGVLVVLAAGCSAAPRVADTSRPPIVSSASPTTPPDPQAEVKAQILSVYAHFTSAYVAAANAGDAQAEDLVAFGSAGGGGTAADIGVAAGMGIVATGTPTWTDAQVTAVADDGRTATVRGCFTAGDWHYVAKKTGRSADPMELDADPAPEPLRTGQTSHPYRVTASLQKPSTGGWFVLYLQAHPEDPC